MSSLIWRTLSALLGVGVAGGLGLGAGQIARQAQQLAATFGAGFVLIVALMAVLMLISIVRMPLSHAGQERRRR